MNIIAVYEVRKPVNGLTEHYYTTDKQKHFENAYCLCFPDELVYYDRYYGEDLFKCPGKIRLLTGREAIWRRLDGTFYFAYFNENVEYVFYDLKEITKEQILSEIINHPHKTYWSNPWYKDWDFEKRPVVLFLNGDEMPPSLWKKIRVLDYLQDGNVSCIWEDPYWRVILSGSLAKQYGIEKDDFGRRKNDLQ